MNSDVQLASFIGIVAAALTVFNMFPQYLRVMRTKQTNDLSRATFISLTCSSALWVLYGVLRSDYVLILANTPVFFFVFSILIVKVRNDKKL